MNFFPKIKTALNWLASGHIIFWSMPWLMILVVAGTITQKEMGLYDAVRTYISSFIFWLGPVPLPGGLSMIALIFLSLVINFLFFSPWSLRKSGIHMTHLGVILLLLGGLVTAVSAKEGFMIIPEGDTVGAMSDYQKRVLIISKDNHVLQEISFDTLHKDQIITVDDIELKLLNICENCGAQAPSGRYKNLKGLAENMELTTLPSDKNPEANFSGLTLEITKSPDRTDQGTYILMEDIPTTPDIDGMEISLTRKAMPLPFAVQLTDFRKIDYPGTRKAQEYESDIIIQDGSLSWPATISMNKPYRYKGYTFYQSSFEQTEQMELTVLNVVKNQGRFFPYISSLVIFLGLMSHLVIRFKEGKK